MDDIQLAVAGHAGTSRNKFADDDIFLEAEERIFLAFDRCFGEDTGGFLEGSGGEEGVGRKSCLGGTKEQVFRLVVPNNDRLTTNDKDFSLL